MKTKLVLPYLALVVVLCGLGLSTSRAHAAQGLAIWTDRSSYYTGDNIQVCYSVPGPGQVDIVDMLANGSTNVLVSGQDDGTGGCFYGVVTPPTGTECVSITYYGLATQTCFQVQDRNVVIYPIAPQCPAYQTYGNGKFYRCNGGGDGNGNGNGYPGKHRHSHDHDDWP